MKIVIAGKNNIAVDFLLYVLRTYPDVEIYAIFNRDDNGTNTFQASFKKFCKYYSIREIKLEDCEDLTDFYFFSLEFDRIIKPQLMNSDHLYNLHFSNLPRGRGVYTSVWPILNGDEISGVTLHKIDAGIDTGDIVEQELFPVSKDETAFSLYMKFCKHAKRVLEQSLSRILESDVVSVPQDNSEASSYSRSSIDISSSDLVVGDSSVRLVRLANALSFRWYQLPRLDGMPLLGAEFSCERGDFKKSKVKEYDDRYVIRDSHGSACIFKDVFQSLVSAIRSSDHSSVLANLNKFNVNEYVREGWSPIMLAAYSGQRFVVEELINAGADINDRNPNGTSVLMYAKEYSLETGDFDFFFSILEMGASIGEEDRFGKTVTQYLQSSTSENAAKLLEAIGD